MFTLLTCISQQIFQLLFLYSIGRYTIFYSCTGYILPIRCVSSHKLVKQNMFHLHKMILVVKYHMRSKLSYILMIIRKIWTGARTATLRIECKHLLLLVSCYVWNTAIQVPTKLSCGAQSRNAKDGFIVNALSFLNTRLHYFLKVLLNWRSHLPWFRFISMLLRIILLDLLSHKSTLIPH
jgi:hypothetical protein